MNTRQMLNNILSFNTSSPIPRWEFAYWYDTLMRWYDEGMPKRYPPTLGIAQFLSAEICAIYDYWRGEYAADYDAHIFFGMDDPILAVPVNTCPLPGYEEMVYAKDAETVTYRRGDGKTVKTTLDGTSMPHFMDYPVKNARDFEEFKVHFDADNMQRYAASMDEFAQKYRDRDFPLQLGAGNFAGFYSVIRECMGVEDSACGFYDQLDLLIQILEFFTDFYIRLYSRVLEKVEVDYVLIWEDMCFKNGPLISPKLFNEFCKPYYRKFINSMKALGVKHFIVDTDGNCDKLIPSFLDVGVTGIYPFEIAAGMDIERTRHEYPNLIIIGGVDKRSLAAGKDAIDTEIRKIDRMLGYGGYLPCTDHAVTPDVSFQNYCYYRSELEQVLRR